MLSLHGPWEYSGTKQVVDLKSAMSTSRAYGYCCGRFLISGSPARASYTAGSYHRVKTSALFLDADSLLLGRLCQDNQLLPRTRKRYAVQFSRLISAKRS